MGKEKEGNMYGQASGYQGQHMRGQSYGNYGNPGGYTGQGYNQPKASMNNGLHFKI